MIISYSSWWSEKVKMVREAHKTLSISTQNRRNRHYHILEKAKLRGKVILELFESDECWCDEIMRMVSTPGNGDLEGEGDNLIGLVHRRNVILFLVHNQQHLRDDFSQSRLQCCMSSLSLFWRGLCSWQSISTLVSVADMESWLTQD